MLMKDEWFGHRDPFYPDIKVGNKDEFIDWDFGLLEAISTIEDLTDEYGIPRWELEDENVRVNAVRRSHKFLAARDKYVGKKGYKGIPGEYFTPDVGTIDPTGKIQTYGEWLEKLAASEE